MANSNDVRRALAGDKSLSGADLSEASLTKANLSGAYLTGADLTEADLTEANLTEADLTEADLTEANLTEANLTGAKLTGSDLMEANLTDANLTEANLWEANLWEANLSGAYLTDASLPLAVLSEAKLTGARLTGADLWRANLTGANLTDANLTGANLTDANLSGADLTGADLTGADLTGADLTGAYLTGADLTGAKNVEIPMRREVRAYGRASGAVLKLLGEGPQSARDYKRKHPAEFERLKALTGGRDFDEATIRQVVEKTSGARWVVTQKKYGSETQRLCPQPNAVLLLNLDLDRSGLSSRQKESLRRLAEVSRQSGHPHEKGSLFTVGWVRYCDGGKTWLVEEVQSDVAFVRFGLKDEAARRHLQDRGFDPEELEDAIKAIEPYTERFYEDALGVAFAIAKESGIAVEMLDYQHKFRRGVELDWWDDPKTYEGDKREMRKAPPERVYTDLPKSMGMSKRDRSEVLPDAPAAWHYRPNPRKRREMIKEGPSHFDPPPRRDGDVRTHYNLNTGGYTVDRWTNSPSGRCRQSAARKAREGAARWLCDDDKVPSVLLLGAYASYSRSGVKKYLASFEVVGAKPDGTPIRMGTRNVHAHVLGTPSDDPVDVRDGSWRQARYSADPPCFVDVATSECLPNDRSIDVFLSSAANTAKKPIYKSQLRKAPSLLPAMFWRPTTVRRNPSGGMVPPVAVQREFQKGLELYNMGLGGEGLRDETVRWARLLAKGVPIDREKARKMANWFARHGASPSENEARRRQAESLAKGEKPSKAAALVAWLLWGGDPAREWSRRLVSSGWA